MIRLPQRRLSLPRLAITLIAILLVAGSFSGLHATAQDDETDPSAEAVGAGGVIATVLGTEGINVRSCPSTDCDVIATVKLGDSLIVTGGVVDGFSPVDYGGVQGYAYDLFLVKQGAPAPFLVQGTPGCKRVAIIFDVGIGDEPEMSILEHLVRDDVPATIFVMGWWAAEHSAELKAMAADGFVIGSHGDQRQELTDLSDDQVTADILNAQTAIATALGQPPSPWFTAYAGATDDRIRGIISQQGYLPVGWNVPAADFDTTATAQSVYDRVVPNIYDGAIVEFHLDGPNSASSTGVALPRIVDDLRSQGYTFVTVPQMAEPCRKSA